MAKSHGKEFNYIRGNKKGPENWGNLCKEWETCKRGRRQSPIDLKAQHAIHNPRLKRLATNYLSSHAVLKNHGCHVMLEWQYDVGSITIDGREYHLLQCHWHTPAEHTFNGQRFDLELHMVHQSRDRRIAVVAVLFRSGLIYQDSLLHELTGHLAKLKGNQKEVSIDAISPWNLGRLGSYYKYEGSLTTPPCTEGVLWIVMEKVCSVSTAQVDWLKQIVGHGFKENARPVQPTNRRIVEMYSESWIQKPARFIKKLLISVIFGCSPKEHPEHR